MTSGQSSAPDRIRGFDGIRALAAVTVVAIHSGAFAALGTRTMQLVQPVTLFFVLSGFLISRNLLVERHRTGGIRLRRFWWHRALRLLPCYYAVLGVVVILAGLGAISAVPLRHLGLASVYLSNFADKEHYHAAIAATWSLAVEEHFYLVWPLVLLLVPRRWLGAALVAALGVCGAARVWFSIGGNGLSDYFWPRFTVPAADALIVGCLLALAVARIDPLLRTRPRHRTAWWLLPLTLVVYLAPLWLPGITSWAWRPTAYYLQVVAMAVGLWLVLSNQSAWLVRALELPPLRWLGKVSYGIYLWQGVVLGTGPAYQEGWWQQFPQSFVLLLAMVTASWYLIEQPIQRWGRRRSAPTRTPMPMPTPTPALGIPSPRARDAQVDDLGQRQPVVPRH